MPPFAGEFQSMLELRGVGKSFGAREILRDVSFAIERGRGIAVVAPSGLGKTTLLRIIAGLERPDTGEVRLDAKPGMVFQDFALWPHMRAWRHIEFVLRGRGSDRRVRRRRAEELLEWLDMAHRAGAYPAQLSGGEQQRLAIARCLATDPALILLDEPFSNLNSEYRKTVQLELRRRMDEEGASLVIACLDEADALGLAEQTLRLGAGGSNLHGPGPAG